MAGALRSLSVKFPFREEPMGRCFTLDILHPFSFLRRVSVFLGLAHVNTEKRVREKQLEVKIIYFNHVNGSSVKLWYSVAFNQINLNFLATSLLIWSCKRASPLRMQSWGQNVGFLFCPGLHWSSFLIFCPLPAETSVRSHLAANDYLGVNLIMKFNILLHILFWSISRLTGCLELTGSFIHSVISYLCFVPGIAPGPQ